MGGTISISTSWTAPWFGGSPAVRIRSWAGLTCGFLRPGVVAVDEENGWVYSRARGERQRPYDVHLYRVKLDGTGLAQLTDQPGWHDVQFAPSERFFLDTHSSLDRPAR